jgi:AraC-like DNA-binding protein
LKKILKPKVSQTLTKEKSETTYENTNKKRGPYLKPLREQAMRQIRHLIIEEGYTPSEVMQQLKIPPRTFQRYLHDAFASEREVLAARLTDDEVLNQLAILESRLTKSRRDIINMAKDPTIDSKQLTAIVVAYDLSEEIAVTIFKMHSQIAPDVLMSRHKQFFKDRELTLNKPKLIEEQEEDVVDYDESDSEEEDYNKEKEDVNNYDGEERRES